jgi:MoaA/NifB/PqqE/SkfB family radical SAM enzyme
MLAMVHWLSRVQRVVIGTNNYCNLRCPKCNTGCDQPIGSHPFRSEKWEFNIPEFSYFIEKVGHLVPRIRLAGGETTCMSIMKVQVALDICFSRNIPVGIITNGYNIIELGADYLSKLDHLILDDHFINRDHIDYLFEWAKQFNIPHLERIIRYKHMDCIELSKNAPKSGIPCNISYKLPYLYDDVLYPCCGSVFMHPELQAIMRKSGWSIYNPDFLETIKRPPPQRFIEICRTECYQNALRKPLIDIKHQVTGIVKK